MDENLEGRTQVKMQTYMSIETKPSQAQSASGARPLKIMSKDFPPQSCKEFSAVGGGTTKASNAPS